MSAAYVADRGPQEVAIYLTDDSGRDAEPYARYRLADLGATPDDVLAAHRWHRIGPWFRSDDMPTDHRVCAVEPVSRIEGTDLGGMP